jgi:predicted PurR-regulated permease PerM
LPGRRHIARLRTGDGFSVVIAAAARDLDVPTFAKAAMSRNRTPVEASPRDLTWSHDRVQSLVLFVATAVALWLCYLLVHPFLPAFAWAVAWAVVVHPLHQWMARHIRNPSIAAGLTVTIVVVALVVPALILGDQLVREVSSLGDFVVREWSSDQLQLLLAQHPRLEALVNSLRPHIDSAAIRSKAADVAVGVGLASVLLQSIDGAVQTLIAFFLLFFFFRDQDKFLHTVQGMVPLSLEESSEAFGRIADMLHATIFGTVAVAVIQGTLGGLMFWWLGLPGPLLWGAVMGVLAVVPLLGPFVIWVPAAGYLAFSGETQKALILAVWGGIVIGLIDNILFPLFVGSRLRLHTVPVFISIVGGLVAFGSAGIIVGPVVLVVTVALLHVWSERNKRHQRARVAIPPAPVTTSEP